MSLTAPVNIGSTVVDNGGGTATFVVVTTVAVAAGDGVLVAFQCLNSGALFSSISDPSNGTYSVVRSATTANGFTVGIAYVLASAALSTSTSITLTTTGSLSGYVAMRAFKELGGLGTLDVSATATQASVTALSVGPTGATAQAVELVMAVFGYYMNSTLAQGFGAGGAYTALAAATAVGASDQNGIFPEYLITSGTGTQTATGTLSISDTSNGNAVLAFTAPVADPFPVGYHNEPPNGGAGQSAYLRMHHRERGTVLPFHRRPSGLHAPAHAYLPGKSGLLRAA